MTPTIPRGWSEATEPGEGLWYSWDSAKAWLPRLSHMTLEPLSHTDTYIRRTDSAAPDDPNEPWPEPAAPASERDIAAFVAELREWSTATFGPGQYVPSLCDHIRLELAEVQTEADMGRPTVIEWIDIAMLALDGAWRSGATNEEVGAALFGKLAINKARKWPDWRTADPNKAMEHEREPSAPAMVPGMMRLDKGGMVALSAVSFHARIDGGVDVYDGTNDPCMDSRTPEQFALDYTAAFEFTEREIGRLRAEGARQADGDDLTAAYFLGSRDAKPAEPERRPASEPPTSIVDVRIMTSHGEVQGWYSSANRAWRVYDVDGEMHLIDPADVLGWRELPRAIVRDGRVVGVTR